jgi:hypothetical protein
VRCEPSHHRVRSRQAATSVQYHTMGPTAAVTVAAARAHGGKVWQLLHATNGGDRQRGRFPHSSQIGFGLPSANSPKFQKKTSPIAAKYYRPLHSCDGSCLVTAALAATRPRARAAASVASVHWFELASPVLRGFSLHSVSSSSCIHLWRACLLQILPPRLWCINVLLVSTMISFIVFRIFDVTCLSALFF